MFNPLKLIVLYHYSGLSTCHFAWAFHSEAEEELINIIPAIQRGDPQWSELRAMGIGWWVRNINTLRRCIEKVTGTIPKTVYYIMYSLRNMYSKLYNVYSS